MAAHSQNAFGEIALYLLSRIGDIDPIGMMQQGARILLSGLDKLVPEENVFMRGDGWMLVHPVPEGLLAKRIGAFAARRRKSLDRIIGDGDRRARVIGHPIRGDRICGVLLNGRVAGYLSYRRDGAGATIADAARFRAEFGVIFGSLRWLATEITLHRGRSDDLYIEGFAVLPQTRGLGIGRALLEWLSSEVRAHGKAGWRTEMPAGHEQARRAYERFGAIATRAVWTGPFAPLLNVRQLTLYRWTPPT